MGNECQTRFKTEKIIYLLAWLGHFVVLKEVWLLNVHAGVTVRCKP